MADYSEHKSAAELEREIEAQRDRVESTIDQIQQKLSPGQMVDELLSYTKSGGGEFVSNLGRVAKNNPLPVALLGVSLAWLIARPGQGPMGGNSRHQRSDRDWDRRLADNGTSYSSHYEEYDYLDEEDDYVTEYPYASVSGSSLTRVGEVTDDKGSRYSEFIDGTGRKFRALTDSMGRRAGHFTDETGNKFRGFTDEAGNRITMFKDEAGNIMHDASGWASNTWRAANRRLRDVQHALGSGGGQLGRRFSSAGSSVQHRASQMGNDMVNMFESQPLVGGALAFAVGAAMGSLIPHTEQEDQVLGDAADKVKREAGHMAEDLYSKGKEQVSSLYEEASSKAGELYDKAKSNVSGATGQSDGSGSANTSSTGSSAYSSAGSQSAMPGSSTYQPGSTSI
jgi:hypothetical protein